MKTKTAIEYTRSQASSLIPLLEGIAAEFLERRRITAMLAEMILSLKASHKIHSGEVETRKRELRDQHLELRRIGNEIEQLGCSLAFVDPLEIYIPSPEGGFVWRAGEYILRTASVGPFAA